MSGKIKVSIMNKLTSLQVRQTIRDLAAQGKKSPAIAKQLGISVWTVRKWRQRLEKGGLFILNLAALRRDA